MRPLDPKTLRRLVVLLGLRLRGDWVVIGGNVLPLLGVSRRMTMDLDVAAPEDAGNDQITHLLEAAIELGVPVEAVNVTAGFSLRAVDGWEEHLVEVHRGPRARILVPDPTLFLLLKMRRLSETDLADCAAMLEFASVSDSRLDRSRVLAAIDFARAKARSSGTLERLRRLREALQD